MQYSLTNESSIGSAFAVYENIYKSWMDRHLNTVYSKISIGLPVDMEITECSYVKSRNPVHPLFEYQIGIKSRTDKKEKVIEYCRDWNWKFIEWGKKELFPEFSVFLYAYT